MSLLVSTCMYTSTNDCIYTTHKITQKSIKSAVRFQGRQEKATNICQCLPLNPQSSLLVWVSHYVFKQMRSWRSKNTKVALPRSYRMWQCQASLSYLTQFKVFTPNQNIKLLSRFRTPAWQSFIQFSVARTRWGSIEAELCHGTSNFASGILKGKNTQRNMSFKTRKPKGHLASHVSVCGHPFCHLDVISLLTLVLWSSFLLLDLYAKRKTTEV